MNLMMMSMTTIMMMMIIMTILITLVSKKSTIDSQKSTPFECGFNPMSYSRIPFSIHFFMIAVIFLIFDIEIIIILPIIFTMKSTMISYWIGTSSSFIMILILGLYHEWMNGMIKWTE